MRHVQYQLVLMRPQLPLPGSRARVEQRTSSGCSVNFKQTFESKGVLDAKQRLLRVSGDVREPFPAAVWLNTSTFLHDTCEVWRVERLCLRQEQQHANAIGPT